MTVPEPLAAALKTMATVAEQIREVEALLLKAAADMNQENPLARETGGDVGPTGRTPSPPGAVHSAEPWDDKPYSGPAVPFVVQITFGDGTGCVAMFAGDTWEQAKANAARAIECVNALTGVPDPKKLMEILHEFVDNYEDRYLGKWEGVNEIGAIAAALKGDADA